MTSTPSTARLGNDAALPADPGQGGSGDTALRANSLGVGNIAFLVVSAAAPLTVIAGSVPLALMIAGPAAPAAYLLVGVALAIFAVGFLGLVAHISKPGGFYTYISLTLGKTVGLGSGILAVIAYNAMQIGIYGLFAIGATSLIRSTTGLDVPWGVTVFVAIALVWLLGFAGIQVGARVLGVILTIEVLMLAVLAIAVIAQRGPAGELTFTAFAPDGIFTPSFAAVLALCFAAFIGFEATVLYRSEARDPERTVPRATYISVIGTTLFYAAIVWVIGQAFGDALIQGAVADAGPELFFFAAAESTLGAWATIVFQCLVVTSAFAALLAFHNSINRYFYILGRDGVLPQRLALTRARTGSPWVAGLTQTALSALVVGAFVIADADPFLNLVIWLNTPGVLGVLILQILAAIAVIVYFAKHPEKRRHRLVVPAAVASAVIMTLVAVLVSVNINVLTGADATTDVVILISMPLAFAVGVVIAAWLRRARPAAYAQIGEDE